MVRWRIWFVLVCALILVTLTAVAQEEQEINLSQPLTLEQCIQLAVENSTDMRNARINLAIDGLRIKDARARYIQIFSLMVVTIFQMRLILDLSAKIMT